MTDTVSLASLSDVFAQADTLPTLPTVAVEILRISREPNASIEELTAVLALDPVLAAKILKLSNSAAFRRGTDITSLERAALLLGMKAVQLLALSFSLTQSLPHHGSNTKFDYLRYWQHSVAMAVAGRDLARLVKSPYQHEAFLCGLLSRIGQLVLAQTLPEPYGDVLAQSPDVLPTAELERQLLGFDHHQVSGFLLQTWSLPSMLIDVVQHWGAPESLPPESDDATRDLCRLIQLSQLMSDLIWQPQKDQALQTIHNESRTYFGIAAVELDTCFVSLEASLADIAGLLDVKMPPLDDFASLLTAARDQMVQVSLGALLDLQHTTEHAQELEEEKQHLATLAQTDKLTGLLNRAGFETTLQEIIDARLQGSSDRPIGILIMDIDHFKIFNDTYGHLVGDKVLQNVATWIADSTRHSDVAARYGGEEFVVMLPDTTIEILEQVAERIRKRISSEQVQHEDQPLSVTISVGGACVKQLRTLKDGMALLQIADQCLYQAKDGGRNRSICCELSNLPS